LDQEELCDDFERDSMYNLEECSDDFSRDQIPMHQRYKRLERLIFEKNCFLKTTGLQMNHKVFGNGDVTMNDIGKGEWGNKLDPQ
jgi:hypothetical protein